MKNNNSNYFDIHNYISSKLEESEILEKVIVRLDEDCHKEPYIEITYIDQDGAEAGLTSNFDNLSIIMNYMSDDYSYVFDVFPNDAVMTIVYDTATEQLNLLKVRNGNYVGDKFLEDFETAIFVGYIINKKLNLSYEEKLKILYEVMKKLMLDAWNEDLESSFIFKIKDEEIFNQCISSDWKDGYSSNETEKEAEKANLAVIESVYNVKLNEESIQKTKKIN